MQFSLKFIAISLRFLSLSLSPFHTHLKRALAIFASSSLNLLFGLTCFLLLINFAIRSCLWLQLTGNRPKASGTNCARFSQLARVAINKWRGECTPYVCAIRIRNIVEPTSNLRVTAHTKAGDDKVEFDTAQHKTHRATAAAAKAAKATKNIEKPIRKQLEKAMPETAMHWVVLTASFNWDTLAISKLYRI